MMLVRKEQDIAFQVVIFFYIELSNKVIQCGLINIDRKFSTCDLLPNFDFFVIFCMSDFLVRFILYFNWFIDHRWLILLLQLLSTIYNCFIIVRCFSLNQIVCATKI